MDGRHSSNTAVIVTGETVKSPKPLRPVSGVATAGIIQALEIERKQLKSGDIYREMEEYSMPLDDSIEVVMHYKPKDTDNSILLCPLPPLAYPEKKETYHPAFVELQLRPLSLKEKSPSGCIMFD